jgi:hypothetical protein
MPVIQAAAAEQSAVRPFFETGAVQPRSRYDCRPGRRRRPALAGLPDEGGRMDLNARTGVRLGHDDDRETEDEVVHDSLHPVPFPRGCCGRPVKHRPR